MFKVYFVIVASQRARALRSRHHVALCSHAVPQSIVPDLWLLNDGPDLNSTDWSRTWCRPHTDFRRCWSEVADDCCMFRSAAQQHLVIGLDGYALVWELMGDNSSTCFDSLYFFHITVRCSTFVRCGCWTLLLRFHVDTVNVIKVIARFARCSFNIHKTRWYVFCCKFSEVCFWTKISKIE